MLLKSQRANNGQDMMKAIYQLEIVDKDKLTFSVFLHCLKVESILCMSSSWDWHTVGSRQTCAKPYYIVDYRQNCAEPFWF